MTAIDKGVDKYYDWAYDGTTKRYNKLRRSKSGKRLVNEKGQAVRQPPAERPRSQPPPEMDRYQQGPNPYGQDGYAESYGGDRDRDRGYSNARARDARGERDARSDWDYSGDYSPPQSVRLGFLVDSKFNCILLTRG